MRTSIASSRSERRASQHQRITTPLRQSGLDQELDQHVFKASSIEPSSQGRLAPIMPRSVTPASEVHRPSIQLADNDNAICVAKLEMVEREAISSGPEMAKVGTKRLPLLVPPQIESAIGVSQERADKASGAPPIEAHNDGNGPPKYNSTASTGVDATQSVVAVGGKAGVQVNTEVARVPSGLVVDAPTDSYPRGPYNPDLDANQVGMPVDFLNPLDKEGDKAEPSFGVLSNTTFHPLLAYQPLLYSHGLNVEEDDHIIEDIDAGFVADSVMEDARTESREAAVSVTATRTLQPFSWGIPTTSGAFHAIFPGAPFAETQMTGFINDSMPVFQHRTRSGPYAAETTIHEETRMQYAAPPQDITWPFVVGGVVHPLPSVEVGLSKELQSSYATYSPTSGPSVFVSQTTSDSSFPSPSPPPSRVDPVPGSPSTCRHIEVHDEEVNDLEGEVVPEPVITASAQREVSPPRYV